MSAHDSPLASPLSPAVSTFNRRRFVALGAALMLSGGPLPAAAAGPDRLIDILYNLAWAPDGAPAEKHAYVVFAPWCPACKHLYVSSRSLAAKMQLRWIPAGSRGTQWRRFNANLGLSRDARQLAALWANGRNTDAEPKRFASIDLNEGVIAAYSRDITEAAGREFGFPTIIYRDNAGVRALSGVPTNFEARLGAVVSDSGRPVDGSKSIALLRRSMAETPLLDGQHAHARRPTAMRALPFDDAPVVGTMRAGSGYLALAEISTEAGRWIAVQFTKQDVRAYLPRAELDLRSA